MTLALDYIWAVPVAIGIGFVYYFAMQDLKPNAADKQPLAKTGDE